MKTDKILLIFLITKLLSGCHDSISRAPPHKENQSKDEPFFIPNPIIKKNEPEYEVEDEPETLLSPESEKDEEPTKSEVDIPSPPKKEGYIEWLKNEKVEGLFEDAVGANKLKAKSVYKFSSLSDAENFKNKFLDDPKYDKVFLDNRLNRYVVPIDEKAQDHLKSVFAHNHPMDIADIDKQLQLLSLAEKKIIAFNAVEISPTTTISRAHYGEKISDRIAKTAELLRNGGDEGWYWHAAASAMDLLISIYRATHQHLLSVDEKKVLAVAQEKILKTDNKGRFSGGLKAHANFVGYIMEQYDNEDTESLKARRKLIREDVSLLLNGGYRKIIDRKTPSKITSIITTAGDPDSYKQPRFFPDEQGNFDTNLIVLQGGGMARHSAMNILMKIKDEKVPGKFSYYYKKIDAGGGAEDVNYDHMTAHGILTTHIQPYFKLKDLGNGQYSIEADIATGRAIPLTNEEKEKVDADPELYRRHMFATLFALLDAERQILFYRSPDLAVDWGEGKGITPDEATEWRYWNNKIKSIRGKVFPDLNKVTPLQQSGNCTVFSAWLTVLALVGEELGYDMLQSFKRLDKEIALSSIRHLKDHLLASKKQIQ